jgi:hypothetical protein
MISGVDEVGLGFGARSADSQNSPPHKSKLLLSFSGLGNSTSTTPDTAVARRLAMLKYK